MVPTTQPEDIASYANRVGNAWKIGRKGVGDGVLLVVAKNDRKVRIEVAKTLEGAIPDLAAKQIIDEAITPHFRKGDFAGGLHAAVDQLIARINGEALPAPKQRQAAQRGGGQGFDWMDLAIFLFIGVPIVGGVLRGIFGRKLGAFASPAPASARSRCSSRPAWSSPAIAGVVALLFSLLSGGVGGLAAAARRLGRRARHRRRRRRRRWRRLVAAAVAAAGAAPAAAATSAAAAPRGTGDGAARSGTHLAACCGTAGSTKPTRASAIPPDCWSASTQRVAASEKRHSGEIRVYVEAGAAVRATCGATRRRASARSRCSASCASGTPSTTTAC